MFLDNLASTVLFLCGAMNLSYEQASERCDLSSRYFGDIACGKTAPTVLTLEKLCNGLETTPNELLLPAEAFISFLSASLWPFSRSAASSSRAGLLSIRSAQVRHYHGTGIPAFL